MALGTKPQKHLINILKSTHNPNFTLFLGAGASVTSGVSPAGKLIQQWRSTYSEMYSEETLSKQSWYDKPNEYSELFEELYDQPSQRREFIENCIRDASPTWGYIYLANLLKNNIFNTIFTTNFDDLINEACYTFSSDLKPIVSAHDSSIKSVRLTSPRPKIIKLHGDFLFDNIKNTVRELESLEDNMRSKFRQYASEFGMIVLGYAGNDRSIMDTLNTLLHSDSNFPHGIYWCVRKGTDTNNLSNDLENLKRFPRFHLIEIDGFDEFLAELHHELGINLQDEVTDPYSSLSDRLNKFVERNDADDGDPHPNAFIQKDISKLSEHVQKIHSAISLMDDMKKLINEILKDKDKDNQEVYKSVEKILSDTTFIKSEIFNNINMFSAPNILLADAALRNNEYHEAIKLSFKSLEKEVNAEAISIAIKAIAAIDKTNELEELVEKLKSIKNISNKEASRLMSASVDLISNEYYEEAKSIIHIIKQHKTSISNRVNSLLDLNHALCDKLSNRDLDSETIFSLKSHTNDAIENGDYWLVFGYSLLLGNENLAMKAAPELEDNQIFVILSKSQPIMRLITEDVYAKVISIADKKGMIAEEETTEVVAIEDATIDDATIDDATIDDAAIDDATIDDATIDDAAIDDDSAQIKLVK